MDHFWSLSLTGGINLSEMSEESQTCRPLPFATPDPAVLTALLPYIPEVAAPDILSACHADSEAIQEQNSALGDK